MRSFNLLIIFLLCYGNASAEVREVTPSHDLQAAIDSAHNGDILRLSAGIYQGNFIVTNEITIDGKNEAIIDAQGQGHGIELQASNVVIKNLTIHNWGHDLTNQNSGIYLDQAHHHITIENNQLNGDGFGIWLQKGHHFDVLDNHISGNPKLRSADRGNGIQLSMVQDAYVEGNQIEHTRDGLYIISSENNLLENNTMRHLRFGVHYMYSHHNSVINNYTYDTRAGYALMNSRHLEVTGNHAYDSREYGFLLNFITQSNISHNYLSKVWTRDQDRALGREGKGLFVYNSGYNTINYNVVESAEIGIHLTAGSEQTKMSGNSFINNPTQVKYVSNSAQEWSQNGQGNYWSNYLGWDLNNDARGDTAFEPNDGIDKILWQYPEAKILMHSPTVLMLRWIQTQFPVLKPPGVKDSYPLMRSIIDLSPTMPSPQG